MKQYSIQPAKTTPTLDGAWDSPAWAEVPAINVARFHEKSSGHRPVTEAKVVYDNAGVYVIFRVQDQYVRCVDTRRNGSMCADSCAEFFVEPVEGRGYFNFEINCGGTLLLHYNEQSASIEYAPVELDDALLDKVNIYHSMTKTVDPEITEPVTWFIEFFAPYEMFEPFVGPVAHGPGVTWRGNFYKCGDKTSHPHWAMWNQIPGALGFHKPEYFAPLKFV